jgi:hypothetical protein
MSRDFILSHAFVILTVKDYLPLPSSFQRAFDLESNLQAVKIKAKMLHHIEN